jgi:hypothetical protein
MPAPRLHALATASEGAHQQQWTPCGCALFNSSTLCIMSICPTCVFDMFVVTVFGDAFGM